MLKAALLAVLTASRLALAQAGQPEDPRAMAARIDALLRKNSELKTRLIDCLGAAAARVAGNLNGSPPTVLAEAIKGLQAMRAAKSGSLVEFERYLLDASVKVNAIPTEVPERSALQGIASTYNDAQQVLEALSTSRELFVVVDLRGRTMKLPLGRNAGLGAIRTKYEGAINPSHCRGAIALGVETVDPVHISSCAAALCTLAEGRLAQLLLPKELAKGTRLWTADGGVYGTVDSLDPDHLFLDGSTGFGVCIRLAAGGYNWLHREEAAGMLAK